MVILMSIPLSPCKGNGMSLSYEITGFCVCVPLSQSQLDRMVQINASEQASVSHTLIMMGATRVGVGARWVPSITFDCPTDQHTRHGRQYIRDITSKLEEMLGEQS